MQKVNRSKIVAIVACLCMLFSTFCQNVVFVFADVKPTTVKIDFAESLYQNRTRTDTIAGIFDISGISIDTGKVDYSIDGDKVTIKVSEGKPSRIGPHTKSVTVTEENTYDEFPEKFLYNLDGYIGDLGKKDSGYYSDKELYWAKYSGNVTKPECEFYSYTVTYTYTLNVAPQLTLASPNNGVNLKDKIDIKGFVKDENVSDSLNIYYTFDTYKDNTVGTAYKSTIIADGTEQKIAGTIDINPFKLADGTHKLYMWAVDKRGVKSVPTETSFILDTIPPDAPTLAQDPITPTNKSVNVDVYYPADAVVKEIRIDGGDWTDFDAVAKDGKIVMDENGTIEARCEDKAGNVSGIGHLVVSNIDKTSPDTPVLTPNTKEPTNQSVTVSVYYPNDPVVKEIKIGEGDWMPYVDPVEVVENTTAEARSKDEAGNYSPVGKLEIFNIDTTLPTAPVITTSADITTKTPITATITPGKDKESGVNRTEYLLEGATTNAWQKYEDGTVITIANIGETKISARTIDNAGNVSPVSIKTVTIKEETKKDDSGNNSGGNNGGNNNGGGVNNNGGGTGGNTNPSNNSNDGGKKVNEPDTKVPAVTAVDLSTFISSNKAKYAEGETITFAIEYKNKSAAAATDVVVKAEIPAYTTAVDLAGGTAKGTSVEWNLSNMAANTSGKIEYKVSVNKLDKAEVSSSNTASIQCKNVTNTEDDSSKTIFLLYSNVANYHTKYIAGYKDNTFRPANNITRAEVAAIMFKVLGIDKAETANKNYIDLKKTHWAYNSINTVTNAGLFEGYKDGSFHPDNYITRAEFATVLANYLKLKNVEHNKINFSDIGNHWAKNFIEEIYRVKLIEGYIEKGDRLFKPDNNISRSEAVTIVNNMLFRGPLSGIKMPFKDVPESHWAHGQILESALDHHYTRNEKDEEVAVQEK